MIYKILVIDDDVSFCSMIKTFLNKKGFETSGVFSFLEAEQLIKKQNFDLVLTDVRLPDSDGVKILQFVKDINPEIQVILMTGYADIKTAVNAMKLGAFDYVSKPINSDEILHTINQALINKLNIAEEKSEQTKVSKTSRNKQLNDLSVVKGKSEVSLELHKYIDLVAPTNISVLVIGDSGTGKENIAFSIHQQSKRASKPYIAVDCGAIPKELAASEFFGHLKGSFTGAINDKIGHFEAANGGTLFLDEVGNLSYEVQVQLLRALQERKIKPIGSSKEIDVDIRVIAATNEDLQRAVREGEFREDLYHRLNEFSIKAPRLSERENDILLFADFFLKQSNADLEKEIIDFSDEVKSIFLDYDWPGNLREMRNVIKRAVLLSSLNYIQKEVLPEEFFNTSSLNKTTNILLDTEDEFKLFSSKNEENTIITALEKAKFNKTKAAQILGIDRKTLYNKIKLYNIEL
ncbi:sigma-54-dependent Fis family transcriptional regulator [Paenimyroides tangerinum]|uniref:Sigma-54-dependent Fis family transcriptional regulator n=1 Tax=Paenimyroides tangerinum TaxID=2488728 RepID=A0A3P3WAC7_9FLAO|nr:sigma-54 dependent transcriptional regulator [Paenimyroides tangerinum]RRJ91307.1 sigma-54-dependent Fis family transcriptional regulator [Paenimyroides tangerinum]